MPMPTKSLAEVQDEAFATLTPPVPEPKRPRGRPRKVQEAPLANDPANDPADVAAKRALAYLEGLAAAPVEAKAAALEAFKEQCRVALTPVPGVIRQLQALEAVHGSELRRLRALPWDHFNHQLLGGSLVQHLRVKVDDTAALLLGAAHRTHTTPSLVEQLTRLAPKVETLTLADQTLASEIIAEAGRADAWPGHLVAAMATIHDLTARLGRALANRGQPVELVTLPAQPNGPGITITTHTGDDADDGADS